MARFVFAWELGGGLGHVMRIRPIVEQLRRRGHDVWLIAKDLRLVETTMGEFGIRRLQAPTRGILRNPIENVATFAHLMHNTSFADEIDLRARAQSWRDALICTNADLLLCDHSPTALVAARGLRIRRATIGTGFSCPSPDVPMQPFCAARAPSVEQLFEHEASLTAIVNRVLASWKAPRINSPASLYEEVDAQFLATFRELDHFPSRKSADYYGCWLGTDGASPEWPTGNGPKVFGYLKPFAALPQLLSLLKERRLPSLIVVPGLTDEAIKKYEGPTLKVIVRPVKMQEACRQCDFAILHATHGSTAAALLAGKPTVLLPMFVEQGLTADRVAEMTAGVTAAIDQPDAMSRAIDAVVSDSRYCAHAEAFAKRYSSYDGQSKVTEIVDRIERLTECN